MNLRKLFTPLFLSGAILFGLSSCDDDFGPVEPALPGLEQAVNGQYDKKFLKINGAEAATTDVVVKIALLKKVISTNKDSIRIVLNHLSVGYANDTIKTFIDPVEINGVTSYNFSGKMSDEDHAVNISGTISESTLTMKYDHKKTGAILGDWKIKKSEDNDDDVVSVFNIKSGIDTPEAKGWDQLLSFFVAPVISSQLGQAVETVNATFAEDGSLRISYVEKPTTADQESIVPIPLAFYSKGDKLFVAIEKEIIDEVLPELIAGKLKLDLDAFKKILVNAGPNHYSIPLSYKVEGTDNTISVDQTVVNKVAELVLPLIPAEGFPGFEDGKWLIDAATHISKAKEIKLGLVFEKAK